MRKFSGWLCTAAGALCWGLSGVFSEYLFSHYPIDASWLTAIRMPSAGFLLLCLAAIQQKKQLFALFHHRRSVLQLLVFAAGLLLSQFAYLSAIQHSNSATATVLQNLSIVMIAALSCLQQRTRPSGRLICSVLLALGGVFLIATNGRPQDMQLSASGLLWGLGAALGAVSYSMQSGPLIRRWGSLPVTGFGMLLGGLLLFPLFGLPFPAGLPASAWLWILLIILVGTVGAYGLFLYGVSRIGPVEGALLSCLEPVTAAVFSALWLGTDFSIADLFGFACILATVLLLSLPGRNRSASSAPAPKAAPNEKKPL